MEAVEYKSNGTVSSRALTQGIGATSQRDKFHIVQDDFLDDWKDLQAKVKTINRMVKNSPLIGGALRLAIEMSVRQADWFFSSDNGEDDPDLELVNEAWDNLSHSWNDHISDAMLMPFYGWVTFTNQYERVNGRMLWRKFKFLQHDTHQWWNFADDGGLESLQQIPYLWPDPIPVARMLIYRFRHNGGNPEGESILRPAWIPFYYGSSLEEIRAIGYERHAAGMPMIKMPMGANGEDGSTDLTTAQKMARNIRVDEQGAIIVPPPLGEGEHMRWDVSLMSAGNAQVFMALNSTIGEYDQKVLMSVLAQFIILAINNVGSQAKAETDVSFFTMAVNAVADSIGETFTKYAVNRLLKLNGREEGHIKLEHSPAGDVDTDTFIELIKAIGGKVNWTPEDEIQLRSIFGMPEKTVDEIESANEEAEMKRQEMARQFQDNQNDNQQPPVDENAAMYASIPDAAPDARQRQAMERSWYATVEKYLKSQRNRVVKGVKEL